MNGMETALSFPDLIKDLEAKKLNTAYFFFGQEDVLMERALKRMKEVALEPGAADFNWNVFRADADDIDWSAFADALTSMPLLATRRVIVLKRTGKALRNKSIIRLIENAVTTPAPDMILVLIEENPDLDKSFYKVLAKHCACVEFPLLRPAQIQQVLKDFAADFDKEIAEAALERILADTDPGLRELLSKLEVLIFYVGEKKVIEPADVEECTAFTREVEIFKLLQALGSRNASEARLVADQLSSRKVELGALISMLYRQIWALYRMKYLQEQRIPNWKWSDMLKIRPAFLEKRYRTYLGNYSRPELGRSIEIIAEADKLRKSSAVQDDYILRTLTERLLEP